MSDMTSIWDVFTGQASRAKDAIDWTEVYQEQLPRVYNFFRYRLGDDQTAEDLTATTFEKAWRGRERYRWDLGAFEAWLFGIARRVAADHLRRPRRDVSLADLPDPADSDPSDPHPADGDPLAETVQRQADLARLGVLLAQLPPRERELIALKYGGEMTNRAIVAVTGLSESNVGTILHRTIGKLRAAWEEQA